MKSDDFDWSVTAAFYSDGPLTYPDPLTHPERSNSNFWSFWFLIELKLN